MSKDEVIETAQAFGDHQDDCAVCSKEDSLGLCLVGMSLMEDFYDALKATLNKGSPKKGDRYHAHKRGAKRTSACAD